MLKRKKMLSAILAAVMLTSAGCGSNPDKTAGGEGDDNKLTWWSRWNIKNDSPLVQALREKTGIEVSFTSPASSNLEENFNLMVASDVLPDIIEYGWNTLPGGPGKYLQENTIIDVKDYVKKCAPNLTAYFKKHPDIEKMCYNDDGQMYMFPALRENESLATYFGPVIRQDWLDELGLAVPETPDEWHNVLTQFKEKKGADASLYFSSVALEKGVVSSGFDVKKDFYIDDDGKVKYGPMEKEFKNFISTMKQWYDEGLINEDFAIDDSNTLDSNVTGGETGILTLGGSATRRYNILMKDIDPNFKLVAIPNMTSKKGKKAKFGFKDLMINELNCAAITGQCKNPELAAKLLDFGYSEEGQLLYNFGIEGTTYEMVEGKPVYTDWWIENSGVDGMAYKYNTANITMIHLQDSQITTADTVDNTVWIDTDEYKHKLPLITPTPEESMKLQNILTDLKAYVEEKMYKFIMGVEPMDKYDEFVNTLKQLRAEEAVEIYQAALERYNKR